MRIPWKCLPVFMQRWSAIVLIAANLVPLAGVLFAGWDAFGVVFVYWLENIIIGLFNVAKMLTVGCFGNPKADESTSIPPVLERLVIFFVMAFYAGFFIVHYGGFSSIHGGLVVALFAPEPLRAAVLHEPGFLGLLSDLVRLAWAGIMNGLGLSFLALFLSHGFSFAYNFIYHREYAVGGGQLMCTPYGRVMVVHVAIILGALPCHLLSSPMPMLVLLVLLKILLDLVFHYVEHQGVAIKEKVVVPNATPNSASLATPSS